MSKIAEGRVKFYDSERNFGFVACAEKGDVFFHESSRGQREGWGIRSQPKSWRIAQKLPRAGDTVMFTAKKAAKGWEAIAWAVSERAPLSKGHEELRAVVKAKVVTIVEAGNYAFASLLDEHGALTKQRIYFANSAGSVATFSDEAIWLQRSSDARYRVQALSKHDTIAAVMSNRKPKPGDAPPVERWTLWSEYAELMDVHPVPFNYAAI